MDNARELSRIATAQKGAVELAGIAKRYPNGALAVDGINLRIARRQLLLSAGTERLRQDDDAADDRRA